MEYALRIVKGMVPLGSKHAKYSKLYPYYKHGENQYRNTQIKNENKENLPYNWYVALSLNMSIFTHMHIQFSRSEPGANNAKAVDSSTVWVIHSLKSWTWWSLWTLCNSEYSVILWYKYLQTLLSVHFYKRLHTECQDEFISIFNM